MQPKTRQRGWFSTIAISLLTLVFLLSFAVCFDVLRRGRWPDGTEGLFIPLLVCIPLGAGFVWRSSRLVQFQVCFWSGICTLIATLSLVGRIIGAIRGGDGHYELQAAPYFVTLAVMVAQALLMTALCLDRPDQRAK